MPISPCQTLVIGDERVKITAITKKLEDDVFFLKDRISTMKQQAAQNTGVLKTYESLLSNRLSVLSWLTLYSLNEQTMSANL